MTTVVSVEELLADATKPVENPESKNQTVSKLTQHDKLGKKKQKKTSKPENLIPRGQPKSGRFWKTPKTKASKLITTRGLVRASTFEKKERLRAELKAAKVLTRERLEARKQKEVDRKERRRENLKRQEVNRLRAEVVQVIRNPAKIKRMRKKQLRNIEKRDTSNM